MLGLGLYLLVIFGLSTYLCGKKPFLWLLALSNALQCPALGVGLSQSMAEGGGSPSLGEVSVADAPVTPRAQALGHGHCQLGLQVPL